MSVFSRMMNIKKERGGVFALLLDPDRSSETSILALAEGAADVGVDIILVGSSLTVRGNFHAMVKQIKNSTKLPVIIFPGAHSQISPHADAILFTSLLSGRNPQYLIDEQVKGAPIIKSFGIEPIATAYLLIESGRYSSVQYMSGSLPIPSEKADIACAHALAAQYMGMQMVFLEAGSGAERSVPESMIESVAGYIDIPLIVGGGIRTPDDVMHKISAGASVVVVGDHFEKSGGNMIREFTAAAHPLTEITV